MRKSLQRLFSKTSLFMVCSLFAAASYVEADCNKGCSNSNNQSNNNQCPFIINGQGSTLLAPWLQASAAAFNATNPGFLVTYNTNPAETGSGAGLAALQAGTVFFAGDDNPLTCAQQTAQPASGGCPLGSLPNRILTFPVAIGVTVITYNNPDVPAGHCFTATELAGIFQCTITNWSQLGFPSRPILPVARLDPSGDTLNFTTYLATTPGDGWTHGATNDFASLGIPCVHLESGNTNVENYVKANVGAIGYVSLGAAQSGGTAIAAIQNLAGNCELPTATTVAAAVTGLCFPLDLNFSTINPPAATNPGAYPIASPTHVIAYEFQPTCCTACEIANWIYYLVTTAQATTSSDSFGLFPLPTALQQQVINNLNFITVCGDVFRPGPCNSSNCPGNCPFTIIAAGGSGGNGGNGSGGNGGTGGTNTNTNTQAEAQLQAQAQAQAQARDVNINKNKKHKRKSRCSR
jgi:phosphate transport system substrate-binding protein